MPVFDEEVSKCLTYIAAFHCEVTNLFLQLRR